MDKFTTGESSSSVRCQISQNEKLKQKKRLIFERHVLRGAQQDGEKGKKGRRGGGRKKKEKKEEKKKKKKKKKK